MTPHSIAWCQPQPVWHRVFGRTAPLELEIGCGQGDFLLQRALAYPQHDIVGIEYKARLVRHINARKQQLGLTNVHVVHGNAWGWTSAAFASSQIAALFLNFPDPWWKKRHGKRRILPDWFVHVLANKAVPQAQFFLQTDVLMTFHHCVQALQKDYLWRNSHGEVLSSSLPNLTNAQSHRERRCLQQDIPIYRAVLTRTHTPAA